MHHGNVTYAISSAGHDRGAHGQPIRGGGGRSLYHIEHDPFFRRVKFLVHKPGCS